MEENGTSILMPDACSAQEGHICLRQHSDITRNPHICLHDHVEFTKHLDCNSKPALWAAGSMKTQ